MALRKGRPRGESEGREGRVERGRKQVGEWKASGGSRWESGKRLAMGEREADLQPVGEREAWQLGGRVASVAVGLRKDTKERRVGLRKGRTRRKSR